MTTATAATAADTTTDPSTLESGELGANIEVVGTESLLTGQEGDADLDPTEVEDAMLAGFNRASGKKPETNDEPEVRADKKPVANNGDDGRQPDDQQRTNPADDPDMPGMGMKASQLKASLARLDALEKSTASTAGHLGHLKQLVQQAGKGKAITKESLTKVREEFGDDYAEALAADLTAAGIGGGASVDDETLGRIVSERVAAERDTLSQTFEKKLVRQRHSDAADYFQGGKHNAEFLGFVGTLPKERQEELANTWDSEVINPVLDQFKAHKAKVANDQTKQTRRMERSVTPTASRGSPVAQPSEDPIVAGWNNVRGRGRGNVRGARA